MSTQQAGKSLLPVVVIAGLIVAAGAVFWIRPWQTTEAPARLTVTVLDLNGIPVPGARVRLRGSERLVVTDDRGHVAVPGTLPHMPDGAAPAPELMRSALEIRAPYLTLRREPAPEIEVREDGTWHTTVRLTPYGLLRLRMDASLLPGLRAELEPHPDSDVEPEDGRSIVRMSKPVSWRVYPPTKHVVVRAVGDTGAAMRRIEIAAPALGHVVQHTLDMPRAEPMGLAVTGAMNLEAPTLSGQLWLTPLEDETQSTSLNDALPIDPVLVPPQGLAMVPHTAKRKYLVMAVPDFLGPSAAVAATPGEAAVLPPAAPAAWSRVVVSESDEDTLRFRGELLIPFGEPARTPDTRTLPAVWVEALTARARNPRIIRKAEARYLVVEQLGTWRIEAYQPSSNTRPPAQASLKIDLRAWGEQPDMAVDLKALPHGSLRIEVPEEDREAFRGASVEIDTGNGDIRTQTVLPRSKGVGMRFLPVGTRTVRIVWRNTARAPETAAVTIEAGRDAVLALPRMAGPR